MIISKKDLKVKKNEVQRKYHIPGQSHIYKRKRNAVFISPSNSPEHEVVKLLVCYKLRKEGKDFITEAVENKTGLRRDVVCLDTGEVYEIETDHRRAKRHAKNINVVMVEEGLEWLRTGQLKN